MELNINIHELNEKQLEQLSEMFYELKDMKSCDLCNKQILFLKGVTNKRAGE